MAEVVVKPEPISIDPVQQEVISKQLKLLLIEMLEQICLVTGRIDISDPTICSSLNAFKTVLKNLETM